MNVSAEETVDRDGKPTLYGFILVRAKTKGIALSLGDHITNIQRMEIDGPKTAATAETAPPELAVEVTADPSPALGSVPTPVASI